MTDVRCVWLTREQRDAIASLIASGRGNAVPRDELVAAWDAAPSNPAEAVQKAIQSAVSGQHLGRISGPKPSAEDFTWHIDTPKAGQAVLRALGMPDD